ncbi:MAG: hypothetical protein K9K39_09550 [Desulfohalobiaceae bacterium]|nr:hypothetical protein [Desulfohalobiaceae bacterium]
MRAVLTVLGILLAFGLIASQASAWWGPHMGSGQASMAYQNPQMAQNVSSLRSEITSLQAELSQELAKENPNMDKVRQLNQDLAQKQQQMRQMGPRRANGYGYHHGQHMRGGHGYCW